MLYFFILFFLKPACLASAEYGCCVREARPERDVTISSILFRVALAGWDLGEGKGLAEAVIGSGRGSVASLGRSQCVRRAATQTSNL